MDLHCFIFESRDNAKKPQPKKQMSPPGAHQKKSPPWQTVANAPTNTPAGIQTLVQAKEAQEEPALAAKSACLTELIAAKQAMKLDRAVCRDYTQKWCWNDATAVLLSHLVNVK